MVKEGPPGFSLIISLGTCFVSLTGQLSHYPGVCEFTFVPLRLFNVLNAVVNVYLVTIAKVIGFLLTL